MELDFLTVPNIQPIDSMLVPLAKDKFVPKGLALPQTLVNFSFTNSKIAGHHAFSEMTQSKVLCLNKKKKRKEKPHLLQSGLQVQFLVYNQ